MLILTLLSTFFVHETIEICKFFDTKMFEITKKKLTLEVSSLQFFMCYFQHFIVQKVSISTPLFGSVILNLVV
jgi:hypothetical protein